MFLPRTDPVLRVHRRELVSITEGLDMYSSPADTVRVESFDKEQCPCTAMEGSKWFLWNVLAMFCCPRRLRVRFRRFPAVSAYLRQLVTNPHGVET